jgi:hypothetical protein
LIIDYIFDWARDLYRAVIYRQLKTLTTNNASDSGSIDSDSDIYSLAPVAHGMRIGMFRKPQDTDIRPYPSFYSAVEDQPANQRESPNLPHHVSSDNFNPYVWSPDELIIPDLEQWKAQDCEYGVFRPLNVIDNEFECVYVTTENLMDILSSLTRNRSVNAMKARLVMQTIESNPLLISNTLLNLLEALWTGTERHPIKGDRPKPPQQRTIVATLAFRVRFSKDWRITRFLTCLAFDATALAALGQKTEYKLNRGFQSGAFKSPQLNEQDVEQLVEYLRTGSAIDNFVAATKQKTKIIVKLEEPKTGFNFISSPNSLRVRDIVSKIKRSTSSILSQWSEDQPLRFSSQTLGQSMEDVPESVADAVFGQQQLSKHPGDSPLEATLRTERSILLYSEPSQSGVWRRNTPIPPFCMFRMGLDQEPPDALYQLELIFDTYKNGKVFFTCHETDNTYSSALRKEEYEVLVQDEKLRLLALDWYRHILWGYMHDRDEHSPGTGLSNSETDPIYGMPIRDGAPPGLLEEIRWLKRKMEIMGDSEEETEEKKADLEKLGPFPMHSVRESPTIIIPERDKVLWERLAKRSGLKHRVIESDQ